MPELAPDRFEHDEYVGIPKSKAMTARKSVQTRCVRIKVSIRSEDVNITDKIKL